MKKNLLILCFAVTAMIGANAQNYNWNFSDGWTGTAGTAGYSATTTVDGLTIVPGGSATNMGAITAGTATVDGVSYTVRFQFNGAGYGGASDANEVPTVNMPTQRYVSFPVNGNVTVDVVGTTGSSSYDRKMFLTDGTNLIGSFVFAVADGKLKRSVNYTGSAATLYLFCNAACNIYHIIVSGGSTAITQTDASKEVKFVEYYDITGRKVADDNLKNTLLIKKTTYTDGTTLSSKVITKVH